MTRKLLSLFLVLALCLGTVLAASASEYTFVVDEQGVLSDSELENLNAIAEEIYQQRGVGIFFVLTQEEKPRNYDVEALVGGMTDYYVMVDNDSDWHAFKAGAGESMDLISESFLRVIYDETETYVEAIENFLTAAAECFPMAEAPVLIAPAPTQQEALMLDTLVMDDADLLSDAQEAELNQLLEHIGNTHSAQLAVVTVPALDSTTPDAYVEYLYDSMAMGYGENRDGVLLMVCMNPREYRILSNGYAGDAIHTGIISQIGDEIVSYLSDGDYAQAFEIFAQQCDYYLNGYRNGFPFNFKKNLLIAVVIGVIIGCLVAFGLKAQLKSVRKQNRADAYVKSGSMHLTTSRDLFLYRNVTRTKRETNKSSSSSRSGGSRSVGGGSF
jgi:uncharacterized protein